MELRVSVVFLGFLVEVFLGFPVEEEVEEEVVFVGFPFSVDDEVEVGVEVVGVEVEVVEMEVVEVFFGFPVDEEDLVFLGLSVEVVLCGFLPFLPFFVFLALCTEELVVVAL